MIGWVSCGFTSFLLIVEARDNISTYVAIKLRGDIIPEANMLCKHLGKIYVFGLHRWSVLVSCCARVGDLLVVYTGLYMY